jgi:hypothetical protein
VLSEFCADRLLTVKLRGPIDPTFRDSNVPFLCEGIAAARSLRSLELSMVHVTVPGMEAILDSLQRNSSLRRILFDFLAFDPIDVSEFGPVLEAFVSSNHKLEHFGFRLRHSNGTHDLLPFVVQGLRRNRRIRVLTGDPGGRGPVSADADDGEQVVAMVRDHNATLQRIEGILYESREHAETTRHLLELNRLGEDFVANAHRVPMEHWGGVLIRIGKADCNYFVTELVRKALGETPAPSVGSEGQQQQEGRATWGS